jgi:hypothetical protein
VPNATAIILSTPLSLWRFPDTCILSYIGMSSEQKAA